MPELPEVEVCRLGISPHIVGERVTEVTVRHKQLRWPIPDEVNALTGQVVNAVERRSKYLLLRFDTGTLVLHLGMSGTIRVINADTAVAKHDHFDLVFAHDKCLRLNDPRRFGAVLWLENHQDHQGILSHLGPEPLTDSFNSEYLQQQAGNRKTPVKSFLMNNKVVVGVGNIYANEALFLSGVHPATKTCELSTDKLSLLVVNVKQVLQQAIAQGGTTLKDFTQADGRPGYFAQSLNVYGKAGQPCPVCQQKLIELRQSNRSSVFCPQCQPLA